MNDFDLYFDPLNHVLDKNYQPGTIGKTIIKNTSGISDKFFKGVKIALFGVCDDRRSESNSATTPDLVRKELYNLQNHFAVKIADLGNLKTGTEPGDTDFAIRDILSHLIEKQIVTIVLGGGQEITYSVYLAYEKAGKAVNIVSIDPRLDINKSKDELSSSNYLSRILLNTKNTLFNYTNLGYQTHYVPQENLDLIKKLYFDAYRLGEIRNLPEEAEPELRDADIVSFDVSAVRMSEAPAHHNPSPNGFFGEEACQLAKYAGLSEKINSFGIYEISPDEEPKNQTVSLAAQLIWYFFEGVAQRKSDHPLRNLALCDKFHVSLNQGKDEIIFYKSQLSGRWWFEIPFKNKRIIVACNPSDYRKACENQVPDKYWKTCQKIF